MRIQNVKLKAIVTSICLLTLLTGSQPSNATMLSAKLKAQCALLLTKLGNWLPNFTDARGYNAKVQEQLQSLTDAQRTYWNEFNPPPKGALAYFGAGNTFVLPEDRELYVSNPGGYSDRRSMFFKGTRVYLRKGLVCAFQPAGIGGIVTGIQNQWYGPAVDEIFDYNMLFMNLEP